MNVVEYIERLQATMGPLAFGVAAGIGLMIVFLFFWFGWKYLWPLRRVTTAMRTAKNRVTGTHDAPEKLFPNGPTQLKELWEAFLRDRKETTNPHKGREISTLDPSEVFYDDAVFGAYNRNFAVTLAGFFTGLGILGTFAGLVIGLEGIDITESSRMYESVGGLLGGMSTAFYTSLIGIFFSLIWLLLDRVLFDQVQKATNGFLHAVRNRYPVESADRLLHHLLDVEQSENRAIHESKTLLEEQKGILQSLSVDLAVAFEEAVTESLENSLSPKLQQMTEAIESLSVQMGDRQVSALDHMVSTFQESLTSELHGHLDGLAGSMAKAAEWQEVVHEELGQLVGRLTEASGRQAELVETTNSAAAAFADSVGALGNANQEIRESLSALEQTSTGVRSLADGMREQAEILEGRISALGRENEVYREANENIREQLAQQVELLEEKLTDLDQFWDELGEGLDDAAHRLQAGATEFSSLTTQKLNEIFARFDSEMATVVEHLAGTLAEIREVTDDLPRNVSAFGEELGNHAERLAEGGDRLERTVARLEILEEVAERLNGLEPVKEGLGDVAAKMGGANRSLDQLIGRVQSVDGHFKTFVDEFVNGGGAGGRQRAGDRPGPQDPGGPDRGGRQ